MQREHVQISRDHGNDRRLIIIRRVYTAEDRHPGKTPVPRTPGMYAEVARQRRR